MQEAAISRSYWGDVLKWVLDHPTDFTRLWSHLSATAEGETPREKWESFIPAGTLLVDFWESFPRPSQASVLVASEITAFEVRIQADAQLFERVKQLRKWLPRLLKLRALLEELFGGE